MNTFRILLEERREKNKISTYLGFLFCFGFVRVEEMRYAGYRKVGGRCQTMEEDINVLRIETKLDLGTGGFYF